MTLNNLALIFEFEGDLTIAKKLLKRAVKIQSNFATAWMNLGIVEMGLEKFNVILK